MRETIDAIYENGVLRPLKPIPWPTEKHAVRVTIDVDNRAAGLNACLGIMPDEDADEMRRMIGEEFEQVNSVAWR